MPWVHYILILSLAGCSGVKPTEKASKKEGTTEQPTEVAGGFGLTMQCSILNREVANATSSEIGCVVSNDDGTKYTGSMTGLKASITAKGQTTAIKASPILSDASSTISVGVNVPGLKPGDALSIAINGVFDKKPATLTATLKGRFAVICDDDVEYFVQANAPAENLACTEKAPCAKISQAVALLPDVYNCAVTVKIAAGIYYDQIKIAGSQQTPAGSLTFLGTSEDFKERPVPERPVSIYPSLNLQPTIDPITGGLIGARSAIEITSFGRNSSLLTLKNIKIIGFSSPSLPVSALTTGVFGNGITIETSQVAIKNLELKDFPTIAIQSTHSSRILVEDTAISNSAQGILAANTEKLILASSVTIVGNQKIGNEQVKPIIKATSGISLIGSRLRTIQNLTTHMKVPILEINGMTDSAISLENGSDTVIADYSRFYLNNNNIGISLTENSTWNWTPAPLKTKVNDPNDGLPILSITNCIKACVTIDNSDFNLSNASTESSTNTTGGYDPTLNRLKFTLQGTAKESVLTDNDADVQARLRRSQESTPDYEHLGLIYATNSSRVDLRYLDNIWCDKGNASNSRDDYKTGFNVITAIYGSQFRMSQKDGTSENICPDTAPDYPLQFIKLYDVEYPQEDHCNAVGVPSVIEGKFACYTGSGTGTLATRKWDNSYEEWYDRVISMSFDWQLIGSN